MEDLLIGNIIIGTRNQLPTPTPGSNKIAFVCNDVKTLYLFRREVIVRLAQSDYEICIIAPFDSHVQYFLQFNVKFINLHLSTHGKNPYSEIKSIYQIRKSILSFEPNLIFSYTIKPNIYTAFANLKLNIPTISIVPGLGIFPDSSKNLRKVISFGYKLMCSRSKELWFLNRHDRGYFEGLGWLAKAYTRILPGEGLDVNQFKYQPLNHNRKLKVLFIGRLLKSKGIEIFAEVAKYCTLNDMPFQFEVAGYLDEQHPQGITAKKLNTWISEKIIKYNGISQHPEREISQSDIVIVPTYYREGLNRVIQEALAIGRPVITTSIPGAGELVTHNKTGYIVPPKNVTAIIDALIHHSSLNYNQRSNMGKRGSKYIHSRYDVNRILSHYWDVIHRLCQPS